MDAIIAPSVLSADFANLAHDSVEIIKDGADWLHLDIMDNHFVPNLTFGPPVVNWLRKHIKKGEGYFDCHLMVSDPASLVPDLAKAEVDMITFHIESFNKGEKSGTKYVSDDYDFEKVTQLVSDIKSRGIECGIAVSPDTPIIDILPVLESGSLDMVLVMTVVPGFGGQSFKHDCMSKVTWVREKYPSIKIQVDGGLDPNTTPMAAKAGANVIVAGSAIFNVEDKKQRIELLRNAVNGVSK